MCGALETVTEIKVERPWDRRICTSVKIPSEESGGGFFVQRRWGKLTGFNGEIPHRGVDRFYGTLLFESFG